MKILKPSTSFKKDLKRYKNQPDHLRKLKVVLDMLEQEIPIPKEYEPHQLKGNKKDQWECHVENNRLLVWKDEKTDTIYLVRFGTHAEVLDL